MPDSRNRGEYGNNRPRQRYRDINFLGNSRGYRRQNSRGEHGNDRCNEYSKVGTGQEKGHLQEVKIIETEVPATGGQDQDLELVQIEIG